MRTVYMSFSTDVIHVSFMAVILRSFKKQATIGGLTIGMLTDEYVASYRKFPVLSFEERVKLFKNIKGIQH